MFKGYPRRKKAEGGTRRVQGGVFHRHGGQGLTQVLRETQSLCLSVWRSVQCGWARCESKRLGPIRHLTMPGGFSAVLLMVTHSLPQRLSPLNPTSVQIIIRRYGGGVLFPSGLGLSSQLDLECVLEGAPGHGQVNHVLCGPAWPLACYPSALNHAPSRTACNLASQYSPCPAR